MSWMRRSAGRPGMDFVDLFRGDKTSEFAEVLRRYSSSGVRATGPISGLNEPQLTEVASEQGVRLPAEYTSFVKFMGLEAGGLEAGGLEAGGLEAGGLFGAEVILYPSILGIKSRAQEMVIEFEVEADLSDALLFASHQGYMYFYMAPEDEIENPPVFCVAEHYPIPDLISDSFTEFIYDFPLS